MNAKTHSKKHIIEESVEAKPRSRSSEPTTLNDEIKSLWKGMIDTGKQDIFGGLGTSLTEQIIGGDTLQEGEAVSLKKAEEAKDTAEEKIQMSSEHMEYFRTIQNVVRSPESPKEVP